MFEIRLQTHAKKFLKKIDREDRQRIIKKLKELSKNPELGKPLTGKLAGLWSLRTGKYRTIYQIKREEILIFVLQIGHRENIYD